VELTFLGTAASEGYPVAFCACANCERARRLAGPNLRHRSAALLDGVLLLDLGPDVMAAALALGVPLTDVRHCLLTHEHGDHLDASNLLSRSPACQVVAPRLGLYGTAGALLRAASAVDHHLPPGGLLAPAVQERLNLALCPIAPGDAFAVGPYRVTAVPAAHDPRLVPLLYVIERDGRALFYATDTGPLPDAAWELLSAWGGRLDAVVLDHTFGLAERSDGHNNGEQFEETIARLRAAGHLGDGCRIVAHHLGHHSNPDHETLARYAAGRGYEVAFDGLTVRV
jgi:phosphoribosyl 1,2-cyclic phosphodiesterase